MEVESNNRKRSRSVIELCAAYTALFADVCYPTNVRVRFGMRELTLRSNEKCVCGLVDKPVSFSSG